MGSSNFSKTVHSAALKSHICIPAVSSYLKLVICLFAHGPHSDLTSHGGSHSFTAPWWKQYIHGLTMDNGAEFNAVSACPYCMFSDFNGHCQTFINLLMAGKLNFRRAILSSNSCCIYFNPFVGVCYLFRN